MSRSTSNSSRMEPPAKKGPAKKAKKAPPALVIPANPNVCYVLSDVSIEDHCFEMINPRGTFSTQEAALKAAWILFKNMGHGYDDSDYEDVDGGEGEDNYAKLMARDLSVVVEEEEKEDNGEEDGEDGWTVYR
jgi:hypothetical protein